MTLTYSRLAQQQILGGGKRAAFFQCVIVGSGFGGAVMAARLSPHFASGELALLERGREIQPGEYPRTMTEAANELRSSLQPLGMYDSTLGNNVDALVGNALGGGSNIYANVILEPYPEVFDTCMDPQNPSGSRCWPQVITYDVLKPYFARVRRMLAVEKLYDREDVARGIVQNDPLVEGSPFYGAEAGCDPQSGQALRDYRGRTVEERPPLAKSVYLRDALEHIQQIDDTLPVAPTHGTNGKGQDGQKAWAPLRNGVFQDQFASQGVFAKAPLAVNLTLIEEGQPNAFGVPQRKCTLCGDCVSGCNVGAKNSLIMNYLPLAKQQGAQIYTQAEVLTIGPTDPASAGADYRYCLQVLQRQVMEGRTLEQVVTVYTNLLVLSAGVFGTVKLLQNTQQRGELAFSNQLGQRFSGNADAIAVSYNGKRRLNSLGYGERTDNAWEVGPTITAMADFRRVPGRRHLVQDAAFPSPLVASAGRLFAGLHAWQFNRRIWHDLRQTAAVAQGEGALNHSQVWLAMGHDSAGGELACDAQGNLQIHWLGAGAQEVYGATQRTFQKLAQLAGARHIANPRATANRLNQGQARPITVHALGGCCMADDIDHGVTDHAGRVYNPVGGVHPGLYVSDGSLCDSSVGANPSLTIAALAERAADEMIAHDLPQLAAATADRRAAPPVSRPRARVVFDRSQDVESRLAPRKRVAPLTKIGVLLLCLLLLWPGFFGPRVQSAPLEALAAPLSEPAVASEVVSGLELHFLPVDSIKPNAPGQMRIGILAPEQPVADILFIHGHADRLDNHSALFTAWRDAGYRVLAFDLPSHGDSNILPIDLYTFDDLFALVRLLERSTLEDPDRPLFLAAWSFGGLVATRLAENPAALASLSRMPQGLILLAPAVTPYPFAGGDGIARVATLTNNPNPQVAGPPSPVAPLQNPLFAVRLLMEAWQAHGSSLPAHLPTLVITADPAEDWYVNADGVIAWGQAQAQQGATLYTFQCPGAKHFLDNEPYPLGPAVRQLATAFVTSVLSGVTADLATWAIDLPEGPTCISAS
ncbi:MAG: alpha/beta fold hydrolase [Caldilineaceae bacterium]